MLCSSKNYQQSTGFMYFIISHRGVCFLDFLHLRIHTLQCNDLLHLVNKTYLHDRRVDGENFIWYCKKITFLICSFQVNECSKKKKLTLCNNYVYSQYFIRLVPRLVIQEATSCSDARIHIAILFFEALVTNFTHVLLI